MPDEQSFFIPLSLYGRLGRAKHYKFQQERHGRSYKEKRVEVFYTIEENIIITVTVYVFYGEWEVEK
jgi:hypothetical protein